jgi:hypothetical protein
MTIANIELSQRQLNEFCRRWKITEFAVFGSALREDFHAQSDIDVLVSFAPQAGWSLFDLVEMQDELEQIFGRAVDLVERDSLQNPFRRRAILENMQVVYAAP